MATDVRAPAAQWRTDTNAPADFKLWVQATHDALVAVGLIQTTDTGQINIAALTTLGGPNASAGYEIFRFNDALQATAPVFIKIEYGNGISVGSGTYLAAAIWLTVGTGTNGAGTLTGVVSARTQLQIGDNVTPFAAGRAIWTSGASNRIAQCLARTGSASNGNVFWSVERTKDATGTDTSEGVHIVMRTQVVASAVNITFYSQTLIFAIATVQTMAVGPMCVVSNDGVGVDVTGTAFYPWQMASKRGNENPPMGWLSYNFGDVNGSSDVAVSIYGASHVYRTLGGDSGQSNAQGIQRAGWRPSTTSTAVTASDAVHFAMRWE